MEKKVDSPPVWKVNRIQKIDTPPPGRCLKFLKFLPPGVLVYFVKQLTSIPISINPFLFQHTQASPTETAICPEVASTLEAAIDSIVSSIETTLQPDYRRHHSILYCHECAQCQHFYKSTKVSQLYSKYSAIWVWVWVADTPTQTHTQILWHLKAPTQNPYPNTQKNPYPYPGMCWKKNPWVGATFFSGKKLLLPIK